MNEGVTKENLAKSENISAEMSPPVNYTHLRVRKGSEKWKEHEPP